MEELESQIAKITLGGSKASANYVHVMAEKAHGSEAELFAVVEMPLLNPAAESSCEKISAAIAGALKRAYKRPLNSINFEIAIGQVNEELGKLASLGQTDWINQLNGILSVKIGANLYVATTGKVAAYLLRNGEFTDISCSAEQAHPLKAFENYASGKIRLNDLIVLSTTQLFNYLSMDRLKQIVQNFSFLNANQTIIELLKENAGPEVAFGALLNLQVPAGQTAEEQVDLENYTVELAAGKKSLWRNIYDYAMNVFAAKTEKREPRTNLPQIDSPAPAAGKKISLKNRFKNFTGKTGRVLSSGRQLMTATKSISLSAKRSLNPQNFRQYTPEKRFFMVSAAVLLLTFVGVVFLARHYKNIETKNSAALAGIKTAQDFANQAESAMYYHNDSEAAGYLSQAKDSLPDKSNISRQDGETYGKLSAQIKDLEAKLEKITEAEVEVIGNLGQGDGLIKLPGVLATQSGSVIISYDKATGAIKDGILKSGGTITNSVYITKTLAAVYAGGGLLIWNYASGQSGAVLAASVPAQQDEAGLAYYPTNNRVYLIDKKNGQIVNFLAGEKGLSKPAMSLKDPSLAKARDLAIDGSIYVLSENGILKFQSGRPAAFSTASLNKPLSGSGKIYTDKDSKYIFVLDSGRDRIVIFDKKGNVQSTLVSDQLKNLKDFQIDEKNKIIYALSGSTLLKVKIP